MKKVVLCLSLLLAATGAIAGVQSTSLGFTAPQISGKSNVYAPAAGDIVYDSADEGFWGYTQSGSWLNFGGSSSDRVPAGAIFPFAGQTAPTGYLLTDGSAVSRTTYSALFAAIGTAYGGGDGSTTFNLPNTSGVFVRGAGSQVISGITYSATAGAKQADQFQGHVHQNPVSNAQIVGGAMNTYYAYPAGASANKDSYGPSSDGANGAPRTGSETRPANISLPYIIKY